MFQNLFALDPSLKRFMSFGDDPNYRESESYVNHNVRFITTLNTGVENLQDYSSLVPILKNLGAKHVDWGVMKDHYPLAV